MATSAQVKARTAKDIEVIPAQILRSAWGRWRSGWAAIYFPLFLVLATRDPDAHAIYYPSADLQTPTMFRPRQPSAPRRGGQAGQASSVNSAP
ncbi:hypothetical protein ACIKT0_00075 [Hansschlegelia beijingensis]|uniref:hypothetical protein n=1 Tax=Hansschlegelia beijingensis TaxID=1133344 RepID=UPI00387F0FA0